MSVLKTSDSKSVCLGCHPLRLQNNPLVYISTLAHFHYAARLQFPLRYYSIYLEGDSITFGRLVEIFIFVVDYLWGRGAMLNRLSLRSNNFDGRPAHYASSWVLHRCFLYFDSSSFCREKARYLINFYSSTLSSIELTWPVHAWRFKHWTPMSLWLSTLPPPEVEYDLLPWRTRPSYSYLGRYPLYWNWKLDLNCMIFKMTTYSDGLPKLQKIPTEY